MLVSGNTARAQLAREHQRRHARDVRLQRDHLQIHQQLEMLLERRRHAGRHVGQGWGPAALTLRRAECAARSRAHRRDTASAAGGRRPADSSAATPPAPSPSRAGCASPARRARRSASVAPTPNSFSNTSRGLLCIGSGCGRRLPRDRVAIRAAERRLAVEHRLFDRQLQRRQRRVLADVLGAAT